MYPSPWALILSASTLRPLLFLSILSNIENRTAIASLTPIYHLSLRYGGPSEDDRLSEDGGPSECGQSSSHTVCGSVKGDRLLALVLGDP